ncbi:MAG: glycosyltransferase [Candidatus Eremiobacteraeota bacterium]|nr:glycosyltransferase [Candidatus Eremiobacteraeota bacterium]
MIHANPAAVRDGVLTVDRKFHVGMLRYTSLIQSPIAAFNPPLRDGETIMDAIEVQTSKLPYRISTNQAELRDLIRDAEIVYGYENYLHAATIAREFGVPYIMILEYDLQTQMTESSSKVKNVLRKGIRHARSALNYIRSIAEMRSAHSLHCNGYPIYEATKLYNPNRLLYLDSRMSADMLISKSEMEYRSASRHDRPLRLLYSGRYEPLKGAVDAVKVGMECLGRGLKIEMHCYGQGSQKAQMQNIATDSRMQIHGAIPYPDLVKLSRTFDVFVCCHIQNDPSCTYLESFGAGLPIVGYDNRMLRGLLKASGAGYASPIGKPGRVVENIVRMIESRGVDMYSVRAFEFAKEHTFESQFQKRVDAINALLKRDCEMKRLSTTPTAT